MRVGNLKILEDALDRTILAVGAMQRIKDDIGSQRSKLRRDIAIDVDPRHPETLSLKGIRARRPGRKAYRPLRGKPAHQDSDMLATHQYPQKITYTLRSDACTKLVSRPNPA
ncbi:hypothetical protein J2W42_002473 [Rhizobium tibeticum]|nr:hypothetical protein [Rhizobium tibeticum]